MSSSGPSTPPEPPRPPRPDPDAHRLARQSVRWAVIGVVVSSVLALAGLYQASHGGGGRDTADGGTGWSTGPAPGPDTAPGTPSPSPSPADASSGATDVLDPGGTPGGDASPDDDGTDGDGGSGGADGLTAAEHELRDSLNSGQWSRESCSHARWQGAKAALFCTVTTVDAYGVPGAGKASVVMYGTKYDRDVVFQSYAGRLQPGNCDAQSGVYGTWRENNTGDSAGDVVCFLSDTGQYVFLCSYYDRPALVQISGADRARLVAWWHTMEPVFTR
ncbi:hypothetical protein OG802_16080 [Streptomyces sp. NBC_00704]|uniref:hypothetical protein n=1 Tax=Streptomyces sp. NBC_00704 TaxID=2975809 RepID=UPI002E37EB31|nr:hypothetical protein [Streptomyces sp. NBC_00704]